MGSLVPMLHHRERCGCFILEILYFIILYFYLIKSNVCIVFFSFNNCLLWPKESTKRAILIALKGSNQIVICLINHVTRAEIYSKARSLNILYITFLMVMQLRNWT